MGFRNGAYAKVWEISPLGDTSTKVRLSISHKNKQTGKYETEFSGFAMFYGAAAKTASRLSEGNRIKLGDCDVTTRFDKEKNKSYTNFKVFSFEEVEDGSGGVTETPVDDGGADVGGKDLPF